MLIAGLLLPGVVIRSRKSSSGLALQILGDHMAPEDFGSPCHLCITVLWVSLKVIFLCDVHWDRTYTALFVCVFFLPTLNANDVLCATEKMSSAAEFDRSE